MGFSRKCIYSIFKKIFKWIAANGKHLELLSTWEMTFKRDFAKKLGFMGKDCIKENKDKFPEQMSLNIQHTHIKRASLMVGLISLKPEYLREIHNSKDQYKA